MKFAVCLSHQHVHAHLHYTRTSFCCTLFQIDGWYTGQSGMTEDQRYYHRKGEIKRQHDTRQASRVSLTRARLIAMPASVYASFCFVSEFDMHGAITLTTPPRLRPSLPRSFARHSTSSSVSVALPHPLSQSPNLSLSEACPTSHSAQHFVSLLHFKIEKLTQFILSL